MMKYHFSTTVKDDNAQRKSFNELTKNTFGFDFTDWYNAGHWGELYIPHALLDGGKVVSNISVNKMKFDAGGIIKNYIQLGTVMTDEEYRGRGLNRTIMENILKESGEGIDGIYLFANDDVLEYYPKFGFEPSKEYEYYMTCADMEHVCPYEIEKADMTQRKQYEKLCHKVTEDLGTLNENDGMYMCENIGLYQFWLDAGIRENIYYIPEKKVYAAAYIEDKILHVQQIFGKEYLEMDRFAKSFGEDLKEVVLEYTPVHKEEFKVREYKEEDCTLFILGEELRCIEKNAMRFPVMSHA